jgi:hypothetical protein
METLRRCANTDCAIDFLVMELIPRSRYQTCICQAFAMLAMQLPFASLDHE